MYYLRKKDRDNMIKFRNIILSAFTEPDYFDKLIYWKLLNNNKNIQTFHNIKWL